MRHKGPGLLAAALLAALALPAAPAAAGALPPQTVEAREHFFGGENVDAAGAVRDDRVLLSWFSVASFAAAIDGHVVLLDSYIHKSEDAPNYVPTTTEELVDLQPEAIFIGHGHFDHAAKTGEIAGRTGALVVGTPEHCTQAEAEAASLGTLAQPLRCIVAAESPDPAGAMRELEPLGKEIGVTALKHVHSAAEPPDGEMHETSLAGGGLPDPNAVLLHPPGPSVVPGLNPAGDEGGTILYQFRVRGFTLTWNDSAGPLRERAPEVLDTLAALPDTDVHVGATLGFNDPTNGMRDPVDYMTRIDADLFYPNHHDFIAEYGVSKSMEGVFRRELAKREGVDGRNDFGEVRWLYDPNDYLRAGLLAFDVDDERFADCLPRRAPVRPTNLAGVRLGRELDEISARVGVEPVLERGRTASWCVGGQEGSVTAVFGEGGRSRLVGTTAESHHQRRIGPGDPARRLRALPRALELGPGLFRATARSRRIFGTSGGRIEFLAVADRALFERPPAVRRFAASLTYNPDRLFFENSESRGRR